LGAAGSEEQVARVLYRAMRFFCLMTVLALVPTGVTAQGKERPDYRFADIPWGSSPSVAKAALGEAGFMVVALVPGAETSQRDTTYLFRFLGWLNREDSATKVDGIADFQLGRLQSINVDVMHGGVHADSIYARVHRRLVEHYGLPAPDSPCGKTCERWGSLDGRSSALLVWHLDKRLSLSYLSPSAVRVLNREANRTKRLF
jgi:hypothetical protein